MNTREIAYLWRCAGFGADPVQLNQARRLGYEGAVEDLLRVHPEPATPEPLTTVVPTGIALTAAQLAGLITWWLNRMAQTRNPLREKMTLFWHGFFTSSADPVFSAGLLLRQNQLLRDNAMGRFEDLLLAVAKDPAMMVYLDGFRNAKGDDKPNENFAREVMEMFSLGPHHYDEGDVKAAARAFTGWSLDWWGGPKFAFNSAGHDDGPKRFLGQIGNFQGDDVLHRLANHPATADHVCRRLYHFFTGTYPEPACLSRLAATFRSHHGHMQPVLKELILSPEFRASAQATSYLSPVEYLVSLVRVIGEPLAQVGDWKLMERLQRMGQMPFLPPSVRGWPGGRAWVNTATLRERIDLARTLLEEHRPRLLPVLESQLGDARGEVAVGRLLTLCHREDTGFPLEGDGRGCNTGFPLEGDGRGCSTGFPLEGDGRGCNTGQSTRKLLAQAYQPDQLWRFFSLIILGPEFHTR